MSVAVHGTATFVEVDGVRYRASVGGDSTLPPLVLLHGFTGSAGSWDVVSPALERTWRTVAIDLVGHGGTDAPDDPSRYGADRQVADLSTVLDALGIRSCALLGYSMGGRLALAFAAALPRRVFALVLESASPGIADGAERAARAASDGRLAERIERGGVPAFVDEWERLPLFASLSDAPADARDRLRRQRLSNVPLGLANSLRGFGQGMQPALHGALPGLTMPVLLVAGSRDEKYAMIAQAMARTIPDAAVRIIDGAGHMPHLEKPDEFAGAVLAFLDARHGPGQASEESDAGRVAAGA